MKVTLDMPDRLDSNVDELYLKKALVATLYGNGKLSVKRRTRPPA